MPHRRLPRRTLPVLLLLLAACRGEEASLPGSDPGGDGDSAAATLAPGRFFERHVVFVSTRGDSTILVPWLIGARTRAGGVDREARGWLARGGVWDGFFDERWESPPTRVPWRVLPHGPVGLVVGEGDAFQRIVFEEGARQLEVLFGPRVAEWSGQRGESFLVHEGSLLLARERVGGMVLDMSRGRRSEDPVPGDWAFLTSGDSVQVVLHQPVGPGEEGRAAFRGLARVADREFQWPEVRVDWTEARSYERARRDVPAAWSLRTPDRELRGELDMTSSRLATGDGDGPQLPVDALFQVRGFLRIADREYPVRGLYRHLQR